MSKNEVVNVDFQQMTGRDFKNELSLTGDDIERVVSHLKQVKEVVSKVLKEGKDGEGDYGVVPGTKKQSLYKAGAEKLMMLFGLGVRVKLADKELDRYENFAMFSYEAEVYHLKTGIVKATCIGTANSWEKKYKDRSVYIQGVFSGKEPTPISDILNTLMKMAQKRAVVGAVILATGASDYFTQDEDEIAEQQPQKREANKADSSRFNSKSDNPADYVCPIGKFKGKKLSDIEAKELEGYLNYLATNNPNPDGQLKTLVDTAREFLRTAK